MTMLSFAGRFTFAFGVSAVVGAQEQLLLIRGPGPVMNFGQQVLGAGDVDRDGTPDIVACAWDGTRGQVWFCSGRNGFALGRPAEDYQYGYSVVPLGDVTGDGYPEFAISGRVTYVYSPWFGVINTLPGGFNCLAPAGDSDRDGANDVFAQTHLGVGIFSGRTGQMLRNYSAVWTPGNRNLAGLGDVTGDGVHDFAVSDSIRGRILVQSGADGGYFATITTNCQSQSEWLSLFALGDVDGDGVNDLAYVECNRQRLVVLSIRTQQVLLELNANGFEYLQGAAPIGDVNRDGHDDFMVSRTGSVQVYSGRTRTIMYEVPGYNFDGIGGVGDINGDGLPDFAIGQTSYNNSLGGVFVYGAVPSSFGEFGTGCAGTAGVPRLSASAGPRVGEQFEVRLSNLVPFSFAVLLIGTSNTAWGPLPLPVDLSVVGMPTCQLFVSGEASVALFNTTGAAGWATTIPPDYGLLRGRFFMQGLPFDAAANQRGVVASNASEATIGG